MFTVCYWVKMIYWNFRIIRLTRPRVLIEESCSTVVYFRDLVICMWRILFWSFNQFEVSSKHRQKDVGFLCWNTPRWPQSLGEVFRSYSCCFEVTPLPVLLSQSKIVLLSRHVSTTKLGSKSVRTCDDIMQYIAHYVKALSGAISLVKIIIINYSIPPPLQL